MKLTKEQYEKYAYLLIRELVEDYPEMAKGESPDYYSEKIGLEIRRAITSNEGDIDALIHNYFGKPFSSIPSRRLIRLGFDSNPIPQSNGVIYMQRSSSSGSLMYVKDLSSNDLILVLAFSKIGSSDDYATAIKNAVEDKLVSLNNNYVIKEKNELLLIVEKQIDYKIDNHEIALDITEKCLDIIKNVYGNENELTYLFDTVYVLFLDVLFIVNTKTWESSIKYISDELLKVIIQKAITE